MSDIDRRRREWLGLAKTVTLATIRRTDPMRSGCVMAAITRAVGESEVTVSDTRAKMGF